MKAYFLVCLVWREMTNPLPPNAYDFIPLNLEKKYGTRPRPDSKSEIIKKDHRAVPPEVFKVFGRFCVAEINGAIYGILKSKSIPMTRLVWWCHEPDERFPPHRKPIFHLDGDGKNNQFSNLTMQRLAHGTRPRNTD